MSDDILEKSEFDYKDERIAFTQGGLVHPKIIPIILRPDVVFPFHVMHLEFHDANWKKVLDKVCEEKTVVGFMYKDEKTDELPEIGRVATSAKIDEIHKTVSGSYLTKFIPINRFFTKKYVEFAPVLTAEVCHYADKPEDDSVLEPLYERFYAFLKRAGEITRAKIWQDMDMDDLREYVDFYVYVHFHTHPRLTMVEKLYALWLRERSTRLEWLLSTVEGTLNENVERMAKVRFDAQNN